MAAEPGAETPKTVPKRKDQKPSPLYRNSKATELRGEDPDFVYTSFSPDVDSPGYIGKRLSPHEIGTPNGWKAMVAAWEPVHSQTDANVRAMDPRTDQGAKVDTLQRYGRQIRCRLPKEEYAKYAQVEEANQKEREKQLHAPDQNRYRQGSTMTAMLLEDDQDEGARTQALIDAGHPIPGMARRST